MWDPGELTRSQMWCHTPGIQYLDCGKRIINWRLARETEVLSPRKGKEEGKKEERGRGNREEGNLKGRKRGEGKETEKRKSKGKRKWNDKGRREGRENRKGAIKCRRAPPSRMDWWLSRKWASYVGGGSLIKAGALPSFLFSLRLCSSVFYHGMTPALIRCYILDTGIFCLCLEWWDISLHYKLPSLKCSATVE